MPKRPPWQMTAVRALLEGLDTWQRSIWLLEFGKILATTFYGDLHTKICQNVLGVCRNRCCFYRIVLKEGDLIGTWWLERGSQLKK